MFGVTVNGVFKKFIFDFSFLAHKYNYFLYIALTASYLAKFITLIAYNK